MERHVNYKNLDPKNSAPAYKYLNNIYRIDPEFNRYHDGTVKVESQSGITVNGTFTYSSHAGHSPDYKSPDGLSASFPALRHLKKIEFFDKYGNKFFEDTFEQVQTFVPSITRISENSFTIPAIGNVWLSTDGAKTWNSVKIFDYSTNTFSVSSELVNSPNTVIVGCIRNPNPPRNPGVALWAINPNYYVLEFADDDEPVSQAISTVKGFLSRIFGK